MEWTNYIHLSCLIRLMNQGFSSVFDFYRFLLKFYSYKGKEIEIVCNFFLFLMHLCSKVNKLCKGIFTYWNSQQKPKVKWTGKNKWSDCVLSMVVEKVNFLHSFVFSFLKFGNFFVFNQSKSIEKNTKILICSQYATRNILRGWRDG